VALMQSVATRVPHLFWREHIELLCCPGCGGALRDQSDAIVCAGCGHRFGLDGNLPLLFWPNEWDQNKNDVTALMRSFYEKTPFPNYDDFDDVGSLIQKARQGRFAKLLDDQVPFGIRVLECGCGTGQMSNLLSIANRTVVGTDMCMNSLKLGQRFKEQNRLDRVTFVQMNLFRPVFRPESFDLVICNGVLHHTADPFLGFQSIARLVKPGGHILVGLYHRYGRLITDLRRWIFRVFGDRLKFLDPNLRRAHSAEAKKTAWFMDQYKNPHESKHTIEEVLGWLRKTNLTFVKSVPHTVPFRPLRDDESLFDPERPGNWLQRRLAELLMVFSGSREGGFFLVIARKD